MLDCYAIVDALLRRSLPDVQVTSEFDSARSRFPNVVWSLAVHGETLNARAGMTAELTVLVHGEPEAAWALASRLHDAVHSWPVEGVVVDAGWVSFVDDLAGFSRTPSTVIPGKSIVEFSGAYSLICRA